MDVLITRGNSTAYGTNINSTRSLFLKLWLFEHMEKRLQFNRNYPPLMVNIQMFDSKIDF